MTQAEMEAAFGQLRERIANLEREREAQQKHWTRWALVTSGLGLVATLVNMTVALVPSTRSELHLATFIFFILSAIFFGKSPPTPATMSIGERWRWIWSR